MIGWYYLHENGDLIFKHDYDGVVADLRDSDLVKQFWFIESAQRIHGWTMLVEALALGADTDRITQLAEKWQMNDEDADEYAKRVHITLSRDGNVWCATAPGFTNVQESPCGFGATKLEAMAELAKAMGLSAGKMWQATFAELLMAKKKAYERSLVPNEGSVPMGSGT